MTAAVAFVVAGVQPTSTGTTAFARTMQELPPILQTDSTPRSETPLRRQLSPPTGSDGSACRCRSRGRPTRLLAFDRAGFSLCERDPSCRPTWYSSPLAYGCVGGDRVQLRDTRAR